MKLYYLPGACSMSSHIIAEETGQPLELVKVNGATKKTENGDDYLAINPNGYVPALQLDDGTILTENIAILSYLADDPNAGALAMPTDRVKRAQLWSLLSYLTSEVHKAYSPLFHKPDAEARTAAVAKHDQRLQTLEEILADHDYLFDDQLSIADAYALVMLNWSDKLGHSLDAFPNIQAYRARGAERPSVHSAFVAEGLIPA